MPGPCQALIDIYLFIGLTWFHVFQFFAMFGIAVPAIEQLLGLVHTVTGLYSMYLTYAVVLSMANGVNILF